MGAGTLWQVPIFHRVDAMPQPNRPSGIRWWRWALLAVVLLVGLAAALVLAPDTQPAINPATGAPGR
jgi:hypothetical protein